MAEHGDLPAVEDKEDETPGYKPPAVMPVSKILELDNEDESLRKYKEALLGSADADKIILYPDNPRNVIVTKLAMVVEGRPDFELDLTGDLNALKSKPCAVKEGTQYQMKIYFFVQRDIVTGLRYVQKSYRKGILVDTQKVMVGSFPPKREIQSFLCPMEHAPSGMLMRGSFNVKSLFTDDDKNEYLKWEWAIELKKDW